ncbi:MAG: YifB family Mg chelatase-like AAA ATPase [Patescibacteria group bacterium]
MLLKISSAANFGVTSIGVTVEVNIASRGMPYFDIVGLPNKSIDESKLRVKNALINSELKFPEKRITVNLAPADIPKEGSFYDLPIAVGIMCGEAELNVPGDALFFGELSLDGTLRHTKGVFLLALFAKENGFNQLFVPADNAQEAASISGVKVYPVEKLTQLVNHLRGSNLINPCIYINSRVKKQITYEYDMGQVFGQEKTKRALEISAAGGHNLLMSGPPGAGKTMLAKSFCSILPELTDKESLEVTQIYSSIGRIDPGNSIITQRPFRSPHHTISYAGMVGGGSIPHPGEISLSHRGVLFMDEFPEFSRGVLEALRQPLEDGNITISRSYGSYTFPSRFILIAACNPCPCGYLGSVGKSCSCSRNQIAMYRKKLSGPILDRIDLFSDVYNVDVGELSTNRIRDKAPVGSDVIKENVQVARERQVYRFRDCGIYSNAEMKNSHIRQSCKIEDGAERLLQKAVVLHSLSARSYFKLIRIAQTISDLSGVDKIGINHMAEAIQFRSSH